MSRIVLDQAAGQLEVREEDLYFAFPDGALDYDCVECGAKCCRGHDYSLRAGDELLIQLQRRPNLRVFVESAVTARPNTYVVRNFSPACFFLDGDGRCNVHRIHGPESKPETCRLFPFNQFLRVGPGLVIMPHAGLCPLRVVQAGASSHRSSHALLAKEMSRSGISTEVPQAITLDPDPMITIQRERQMLHLVNDYARARRYREFFAAQVRVQGGPPPEPGSEERVLELICALLGTTTEVGDPDDPDLARVTIALTPYLRARVVFLPANHSEVRFYASSDRAPHIALATHILAALALDAGLGAVTYQGIVKLIEDFGSLLLLLAHVDCQVHWGPSVMLDLPMPQHPAFEMAFLRVARDLLPSRQRRSPRILAEVVNAAMDAIDSDERVAFLKAVADRLAGRVVPVRSQDRKLNTRPSLRSMVQRWGLDHLGDQLVGVAYARNRVEQSRELARGK